MSVLGSWFKFGYETDRGADAMRAFCRRDLNEDAASSADDDDGRRVAAMPPRAELERVAYDFFGRNAARRRRQRNNNNTVTSCGHEPADDTSSADTWSTSSTSSSSSSEVPSVPPSRRSSRSPASLAVLAAPWTTATIPATCDDDERPANLDAADPLDGGGGGLFFDDVDDTHHHRDDAQDDDGAAIVGPSTHHAHTSPRFGPRPPDQALAAATAEMENRAGRIFRALAGLDDDALDLQPLRPATSANAAAQVTTVHGASLGSIFPAGGEAGNDGRGASELDARLALHVLAPSAATRAVDAPREARVPRLAAAGVTLYVGAAALQLYYGGAALQSPTAPVVFETEIAAAQVDVAAMERAQQGRRLRRGRRGGAGRAHAEPPLQYVGAGAGGSDASYVAGGFRAPPFADPEAVFPFTVARPTVLSTPAPILRAPAAAAPPVDATAPQEVSGDANQLMVAVKETADPLWVATRAAIAAGTTPTSTTTARPTTMDFAVSGRSTSVSMTSPPQPLSNTFEAFDGASFPSADFTATPTTTASTTASGSHGSGRPFPVPEAAPLRGAEATTVRVSSATTPAPVYGHALTPLATPNRTAWAFGAAATGGRPSPAASSLPGEDPCLFPPGASTGSYFLLTGGSASAHMSGRLLHANVTNSVWLGRLSVPPHQGVAHAAAETCVYWTEVPLAQSPPPRCFHTATLRRYSHQILRGRTRPRPAPPTSSTPVTPSPVVATATATPTFSPRGAVATVYHRYTCETLLFGGFTMAHSPCVWRHAGGGVGTPEVTLARPPVGVSPVLSQLAVVEVTLEAKAEHNVAPGSRAAAQAYIPHVAERCVFGAYRMVATSGTEPTPRAGHSAATLDANGCSLHVGGSSAGSPGCGRGNSNPDARWLIVVGGYGFSPATPFMPESTTDPSTTTDTPTPPQSSGGVWRYLADAHMLDLETLQWRQIRTPDVMPPRAFHTMHVSGAAVVPPLCREKVVRGGLRKRKTRSTLAIRAVLVGGEVRGHNIGTALALDFAVSSSLTTTLPATPVTARDAVAPLASGNHEAARISSRIRRGASWCPVFAPPRFGTDDPFGAIGRTHGAMAAAAPMPVWLDTVPLATTTRAGLRPNQPQASHATPLVGLTLLWGAQATAHPRGGIYAAGIDTFNVTEVVSASLPSAPATPGGDLVTGAATRLAAQWLSQAR